MAGAVFGTFGFEPICAFHNDRRGVRDGLAVIDSGRPIPESTHCREGRPFARLAFLALHRFEHPALFATNIGAGARLDMNIEAPGESERLLTQDSRLVTFPNCLTDQAVALSVFAAHVDERRGRLNPH